MPVRPAGLDRLALKYDLQNAKISLDQVIYLHQDRQQYLFRGHFMQLIHF